MPRLYYAAVMADVKISDTGDIKEDKISEEFELCEFISNHRCQFTHLFVFVKHPDGYELDNIIHLSGDFRRQVDKENDKLPLTDQADTNC